MMMQSRGFTAFCCAAAVLLLAIPSQGWIGQQHSFVADKKSAMTTTSTSSSSSAAETTSPMSFLADCSLGRQMSTLGFGCVLAAMTAFGGVAVPTSPAWADAGKFSYDPNLGGPQTWSGLQVEGNQCSGSKQSPIAIKPTGCNIGANYEMQVRVVLFPPFSFCSCFEEMGVVSVVVKFFQWHVCVYAQHLLLFLSASSFEITTI